MILDAWSRTYKNNVKNLQRSAPVRSAILASYINFTMFQDISILLSYLLTFVSAFYRCSQYYRSNLLAATPLRPKFFSRCIYHISSIFSLHKSKIFVSYPLCIIKFSFRQILSKNILAENRKKSEKSAEIFLLKICRNEKFLT